MTILSSNFERCNGTRFAKRYVIAGLLIGTLGACHPKGPIQSTPDDAGLLGGDPDGATHPMHDADLGDALASDIGVLEVTLTGYLFGEGASDRDDGQMTPATPSADGTPVVSAGGRILGATITAYSSDGAILSRTTTDSVGRFSVAAPANTNVWLSATPTAEYLGGVRVESTHGSDYAANDFVLPLRSGVQATAMYLGMTYDPAQGVLGVGFDPADPNAGGEGITIATDVPHSPPANLYMGGVHVTNILPPICPAPALPTGLACVASRSEQIHFLNVGTTMIQLMPISPALGTCRLRYQMDGWMIAADALTDVDVDCAR